MPLSLVPTHSLYIHSTFVLPHLKCLPNYLLICSCKNSTLGRCEANCDSASTVGCYLLPFIYMWLHLHHSDGKAFVTDCSVLIHSWHAAIKCVQSFNIPFHLLNLPAMKWLTAILIFFPSLHFVECSNLLYLIILLQVRPQG